MVDGFFGRHLGSGNLAWEIWFGELFVRREQTVVGKPGHAGRVTLPYVDNIREIGKNGRDERPARPQS